MTRRTVFLATKAARQRAKALIDAAPGNYAMTIGEETRTQEQNRLMWPLIKDMRDQIDGFARYDADDTKLRFLHALGSELRHIEDLDETGFFPVGQRSSTLTKSRFSELIELMFEWGSRHGVEWSRKSEETRAAVTRDSDRSAEGGETAKTGSTGGKSAGRNGIAQTPHGANQ